MSEQGDLPTDLVPPPDGPALPPTEKPARRRAESSAVLGWIIGSAVVLILAVAGGLFTAWIVANLRAVPGPAAVATPTPAVSAQVSASPTATASAAPTEAPRRTPTPEPTVEITPAPFVHVVAKGESLNYIASLYQVDAQDIIELNNIENANRIQVGQELLIPGYGVQPTPKPPKTPKPGKTPRK